MCYKSIREVSQVDYFYWTFSPLTTRTTSTTFLILNRRQRGSLHAGGRREPFDVAPLVAGARDRG